jgi:hypothetical protein
MSGRTCRDTPIAILSPDPSVAEHPDKQGPPDTPDAPQALTNRRGAIMNGS